MVLVLLKYKHINIDLCLGSWKEKINLLLLND